MAIYTYNDDFLVSSIESDTLDSEENKAIEEVDKLTIEDDFYKEKLVIAKVYIALALLQLENEGMKAKYDSYSKEFKSYFSLAKSKSSASNISAMPIMRG